MSMQGVVKILRLFGALYCEQNCSEYQRTVNYSLFLAAKQIDVKKFSYKKLWLTNETIRIYTWILLKKFGYAVGWSRL